MIRRVWRGWTTRENAPVYERLLLSTIFPGIAARGIEGYRGIELLRRELETGEWEFMTVMSFDSWGAVRAFAGDDYSRAYVPAAAREVLARFDDTSAHYEVVAANPS